MDQSIGALRNEHAALRKNIQALEEKVAFLTQHNTLAAGISGETLISKIVNGHMTSYAASFDVVDGEGRRIEVKYSRMNSAQKGADTKRWCWGKIFGEGGHKDFDYMLLMGDKNERWRGSYKDAEGPFIFFCIPFDRVAELTMSMNAGRYRAIQLTSNPQTAKSRAARLFTQYQVTAIELGHTFGL
jgi:hypothetical protein